MGLRSIDRAQFADQADDVGGHVEVYRDDADEWRWRRVAANGADVAGPQEGYRHKTDCVVMAMRLNPLVNVYEVTSIE